MSKLDEARLPSLKDKLSGEVVEEPKKEKKEPKVGVIKKIKKKK